MDRAVSWPPTRPAMPMAETPSLPSSRLVKYCFSRCASISRAQRGGVGDAAGGHVLELHGVDEGVAFGLAHLAQQRLAQRGHVQRKHHTTRSARGLSWLA